MTDKPDYRGFRITEIHAITGIGDDDEEGVPAWFSHDGPVPLIAADSKRLENIKEMAQRIADATGQSFKITRFSVREDIGEIKSRKPS
jgi:hypothetical protein